MAYCAYAKLNLTLTITDRRADGYHQLASLVAFTEWGDRLALRKTRATSLVATGTYGDICVIEDNLILRALSVIEAQIGRSLPTRIELHKEIPIAAGLGGGSADAAAILVGLNELWHLNFSSRQLYDFACLLGADVSVCLVPHYGAAAAWMEGIGHEVTPYTQFEAFDVIIIPLGVPLSTADIFSYFDTYAGKFSSSPPPLNPACDNLLAYFEAHSNDLADAAIAHAPQITRHLEMLYNAGALYANMSGSGGACFGLWHSGDAKSVQLDVTHIKTRILRVF